MRGPAAMTAQYHPPDVCAPVPPMHGDVVALAAYDGLEADWLGLEAVADGSPFTTWPWVATWLRNLPAEVVPLVFRARDAGGLAALGILVQAPERGLGRLFGRCSLLLQETADPELDEITVEYAGLLVRHGAGPAAYAALFATLGERMRHWRRLRIAATTHGEDIVAALPGSMRAFSIDAPRAHYVDLAAVRAAGGDYPATLGKSSRSNLRQTTRAYARLGPLRSEVAGDAATALAWLDALEALHTRYWRSKGKHGAFGSAFFGRFHRDLVATGARSGYTRITRVTAGTDVVGYLYTLCWRNRIYFYNSGLDYGLLGHHDRPGVASLHAAIDQAMREGFDEFDFLAGDQGYKARMGTHWRRLHSIDVRRRGPRSACEQVLARLVHRERAGAPLAQALAPAGTDRG
jgi:CelD/BcsL family acetyltransferase involved in cellulose biosynthesis